MIDSHQHFWRYDEAQYPWIPKGSALHRDGLPQDWQAAAGPIGFESSIAVQARQSLEESRWLLELADVHESIIGVVGWVDLRSERVAEQLAKFAQHPKFVGVRHVVQDEPDEQFLVRPEFVRGIAALQEFNLAYDLLIFPKQLPAAIELVRKFPEQRFVLDHIAKPLVKSGIISPWREQIRELAQSPNVWCKVSGLITEADQHAWKPEEFWPYLDIVFESFGVARLMFGSDWPVCLLAGSFEKVHGLVRGYMGSKCGDEQDKVFAENAMRFYLIR